MDQSIRSHFMTDSSENATPLKSTKSINSNSSVQIQIKSNVQCEFVPRDTEESGFLDWVDLGGGEFSMETVRVCKLCTRRLRSFDWGWIISFQCVAKCCSVLQCGAVCIAVCVSVIQSDAECCQVLQSVAACCGVLQWVAVGCSVM
jgi:hypothetical protein